MVKVSFVWLAEKKNKMWMVDAELKKKLQAKRLLVRAAVHVYTVHPTS